MSLAWVYWAFALGIVLSGPFWLLVGRQSCQRTHVHLERRVEVLRQDGEEVVYNTGWRRQVGRQAADRVAKSMKGE